MLTYFVSIWRWTYSAGLLLAFTFTLSGQDMESGFTRLFDGRTLAGWTIEQGPETAFYVHDGAIVVHEGSNFPTWLRSDRQYENFDFRGEFFIKGWINSGIYLHAPQHGRKTETRLKIAI